MIESVNYIRDYGIFKEYDDQHDELPAFATRNLIYGWNYSGKTTLSRIFRSLEKEDHHDDFADGSFSLALNDGTEITESNLEVVDFPVRVFNSDYVTENLVWSEGVEPIFVLGEKSIELQQRLDQLDSWLGRRREFVNTLESREGSIRDQLNTEATRTARRVRTDFNRTPFRRSPHLTDVVHNIGEDYEEYILSEGEEADARAVLSAEERDEIEQQDKCPPFEAQYQAAKDMLERTPKQKIIQRLRDDPELERWVEKGLPLHEDTDQCQFCSQALPSDWITRLRGHFSTEYEQLKHEIEELIDAFEGRKIALELPDDAKVYPDLRSKYVERCQQCRSLAESLNDQIDSVIEQLHNKLRDPGEKQQVNEEDPTRLYEALSTEVEKLNSIIEQHNERCRNFNSARKDAQHKLVQHEAACYVEEVDYYKKQERIESFERRQERWRERIEDLEDERTEIELQLSEEARGANRVNHFMSLYFGARDMEVSVTEDDRYVLRRDGRRAKNLSEGERTAIAFSYFCASLEEKGKALEESLIYIDDPVSSLDSNHVFNTFGIIKTIGAKCRQLVVSTHNYEFFRLCKQGSFFQEKVNGSKRASWYLLRRTDVGGSELRDLPVTLRRYNSEYHYLFDLVYSFHRDPKEHEFLVGLLPNIVRRLLETYSSFRIPNTAMNLYQRLERLIPEEDELRNQIYMFSNHGSHSDSMGYGREFPQSAESHQVVGKVLEVLESNDPLHYEGMMALLSN